MRARRRTGRACPCRARSRATRRRTAPAGPASISRSRGRSDGGKAGCIDGLRSAERDRHAGAAAPSRHVRLVPEEIRKARIARGRTRITESKLGHRRSPMADMERASAPRVLLGVTGGIAAYKSSRARSATRRARLRSAGRDDARRARVRRPADVPGRLGPARARRPLGSGCRGRDGPHRARALGRRRRRRARDRALPRHAGRRLRRRSALHALSRDDGADRARARDESGDVGEPGRASESRAARSARRALLGPAAGDQACGETGLGPHARAERDRGRVARKHGHACACSLSRA